jgi:hypothetical protein
MGEDLNLEERNSIRTPMQWTPDMNAGFSTAGPSSLVRPVIDKGAFNYRKVNVQAQRRDPNSLLNYLERMIRTRKEYPEFSTGTYRVLETSEPTKIFAHSCQDENGNAVIAAHNLREAPIKVVIKLWEKTFDHFIHLFDERADVGAMGACRSHEWNVMEQKCGDAPKQGMGQPQETHEDPNTQSQSSINQRHRSKITRCGLLDLGRDFYDALLLRYPGIISTSLLSSRAPYNKRKNAST